MNRILIIFLLSFLISCESQAPEIAPNFNIDDSFLEDYWITAIAFEADGTAWLGTVEKGIIRVKDGKTKVFDATNSNLPDSLWINDIEIDQSGNVWIGTEGIIKFDGSTFTGYYSDRAENYGKPVRDLEIGHDNQLWIAGNISDPDLYSSIDGLDWQSNPADIQSQYGTLIINSIAIDKDDNVWMSVNGTVNNAYIAKFNGNMWETFGAEELGFQPYWIKDIDTDSQNRVWGVIDYSLSSTFFEYRPILFSFDGNTGKSFLPGEDFQNFFLASKIMVDANDRVWVTGTRSISILENEQWIANFSLPNERTIFTIAEFSANQVWIGTDKGITVVNVMDILE